MLLALVLSSTCFLAPIRTPPIAATHHDYSRAIGIAAESTPPTQRTLRSAQLLYGALAAAAAFSSFSAPSRMERAVIESIVFALVCDFGPSAARDLAASNDFRLRFIQPSSANRRVPLGRVSSTSF